jgi:competence protein ComEC
MSLDEQLRHSPYVRLALALLAGIVWQTAVGAGDSAAAIALSLAFVYWLLPLVPSLAAGARPWVRGGVGLLCIFFVGAALAERQPSSTSLPIDEPVWIQAEVCDNPLHYEGYTKVQAIVRQYATARDTVAANEPVILYLATSDKAPAAPPVTGAMLVLYTRLSPIPPPGNPDEFDYRRLLARRGVFASAYVPVENYFVDNRLDFWRTVRYAPTRVQQSGLEVFAESPVGEKEYAILVALTLGNKQWIDDEIRASYVAAGAMHILAVSGLHVGIIMMVFRFLLSFLGKERRRVVVRNVLVIVLLWFYAAIVGFSPAVTRATVMFSFVLAGATLQRRLSIYNSLAASAFFIACFRPMVIFEAGFQLSYCAVLSIVYFQPRMARRLYIKNKLGNAIWQLATVSAAAQLGTMPVSLLNFHLFPNYFLLTNICILSLTGFIVYGGVAFLVVHQIPVLSTLSGYTLQAMLWLLNHIVQTVERLPGSTLRDIYLHPWQAALLAAAILCIAGYVARPRRRWLWAAAGCLTAILCLHTAHVVQLREQKGMVVYRVKNASYIAFIDGFEAVTVRDEAHLTDNFSFPTGNFFIKHRLTAHTRTLTTAALARSDTALAPIYCYRGWVLFDNQSCKILENETLDRRLPPLSADYLIVTGAARMKPETALRRYAPRQVIADASVPVYRARLWQQAAEAQHLPFHDVRNQGAFVAMNNREQELRVKN